MESPVDVRLADGNLGIGNEFPDGLHLKIGVAESAEAEIVYTIASKREALARFGAGPLYDTLARHFEEGGAALYAMRPVNDTDGTIGEVTHTGTSPTMTTSGKPTGAKNIIVEVVLGGAHQTATYRFSLDGGVTWSSVYTTPEAATPILLGAGVSVSFAAGTFVAGERYSFATTAPTASAAKFLTAIDKARAAYDPEKCAYTFIHVVGGFARSFWDSVDSKCDDFESNRIFIPVILEHPAYTTGEVSAYLQAMLDDLRLFQSKRIAIACGFIKYGNDTVYRSNAILLCANLSRSRTNIHPGWVKEFRSKTGKSIQHWDDLQDFISDLESANAILAVSYPNWTGIYIKKDHLMSPSDSDYQTIHDIRPADKARRIAYAKIMPFVNGDAEGSGSGLDSLVADVSLEISTNMEEPGKEEIGGHEIHFSYNADTEEVTGSIDLFKKGTMEKITIDVGYKKAS